MDNDVKNINLTTSYVVKEEETDGVDWKVWDSADQPSSVKIEKSDEETYDDLVARSGNTDYDDNSSVRPKLPTSTVECEECHRTFSHVSELLHHKTIHTETFTRAYDCENCGKKFPSRRVIKNHVRKCQKKMCYRCPKCPRKFPREGKMELHFKTHASKFRSFFCAVCGKSFHTLNTLERHGEIHQKSKQYQCQICGKAFSDQSSVRNHVVVHSSDKPFKCDTCGKGFKRMSHLTYHTWSHSGVRPYQCDICDRSFNFPSLLQDHKNKHLGLPRLYPNKLKLTTTCHLCGKDFKTRNSLLRHVKQFHYENRKECGLCGKKFRDQHDLTVHIRTHSREKPFSCAVCDCKFTTKSNLKVHFKTNHKEPKISIKTEKS